MTEAENVFTRSIDEYGPTQYLEYDSKYNTLYQTIIF